MRTRKRTPVLREVEVSFKSPDTLDIELFKAFNVRYYPGERRVLYDRNGTGYPGSPAEVDYERLVRLTTETVESEPVDVSTKEWGAAADYILEKVESILAD